MKASFYHSIQRAEPFELVVKGSKFIAYAFNISGKQEADSKLEEIKQMHPKARHWCYAWKLGTDEFLYKAFDDGEPSGSAGKPILNQIESFGLTFTMVIVVRYFGGSLLGVPGLIKAYKDSSWHCLNTAEKSIIAIRNRYYYEGSIEKIQTLLSILKSLNLRVEQFQLSTPSTIAFDIPIQDESAWFAKIRSKLEKRTSPADSLNYTFQDVQFIKKETII